MKLDIIRKGQDDYDGKHDIVFLHVNEHEAALLIKSLSSQMCCENANTGREEFFCVGGEYFSIGITCPAGRSSPLEHWMED